MQEAGITMTKVWFQYKICIEQPFESKVIVVVTLLTRGGWLELLETHKLIDCFELKGNLK